MLKLAQFACAFGTLVAAMPVTQLSAQDGSGGALSPSERAAQAMPQPGDRIFVHFLRDRELSDTVTVNERGQAAFPKLGLLMVGDMTIAKLTDSLRVRYAEYLRTPELEIMVLRRVVVNGEVRAPNVYTVDIASTVADVIARAGGFTDAANRDKITLVRNGESNPVHGWDSGGAALLELQSGDEILVGRKNWFLLNVLPTISTAVIVASLIISVSR